MSYVLEFSTQLGVPCSRAWRWITSFDDFSKEMAPYMRMSKPEGLKTLADVEFVPGQRLLRSRIYLFGFIPVDYSDLTLIRVEEGVGFVEQSPMGSMRLWRHERRIIPTGETCMITDILNFEPAFLGPVVYRLVRLFFIHRHRQLKKYLGAPDPKRLPQ